MRIFKRYAGGRLLLLGLFALLALGGCAALFFTAPHMLPPLLFAERTLAVIAAIRVCAQDALPESRLARLTLAVALPFFGSALCFFFRPIRGEAQPSALPASSSRFARLAGSPENRAERADYFPTGEAWRAPFLSDLAAARREILLEYYIVAEGVLWSEIFRILRRKAAEGVQVRLLFDAFGCALALPSRFVRDMARAGICAKPFRKLSLRADAARRDHRKLAVIDGAVAYVGGINLADEYVGEEIRFGHWKDSALRLTGGVVSDFRHMFLRTWGAKNRPLAPENICVPAQFGHTMPAIAVSDDAVGRITGAAEDVIGAVTKLRALLSDADIIITESHNHTEMRLQGASPDTIAEAIEETSDTFSDVAFSFIVWTKELTPVSVAHDAEAVMAEDGDVKRMAM